MLNHNHEYNINNNLQESQRLFEFSHKKIHIVSEHTTTTKQQ